MKSALVSCLVGYLLKKRTGLDLDARLAVKLRGGPPTPDYCFPPFVHSTQSERGISKACTGILLLWSPRPRRKRINSRFSPISCAGKDSAPLRCGEGEVWGASFFSGLRPRIPRPAGHDSGSWENSTYLLTFIPLCLWSCSIDRSTNWREQLLDRASSPLSGTSTGLFFHSNRSRLQIILQDGFLHQGRGSTDPKECLQLACLCHRSGRWFCCCHDWI